MGLVSDFGFFQEFSIFIYCFLRFGRYTVIRRHSGSVRHGSIPLQQLQSTGLLGKERRKGTAGIKTNRS